MFMRSVDYIDPATEEAAVGIEDDDDAAAPTGARLAPEHLTVAAGQAGWRLDRALAALLPAVSRSRIQVWIEAGGAAVNGREARASDRVVAGDLIRIQPQAPDSACAFDAQSMDLPIVYEDEALIVIDKPAGLVVHPGAGNWNGTLLNGLLAHHGALAAVPRAGIVHRLDAGTSGLLVVAKTIEVQTDLVRQLQQRAVLREYWAVAVGLAPAQGSIDAALARDPRNRLRFRVSAAAHAREARTDFKRIAASEAGAGGVNAVLSWLACRLHTGRTHQIRVHLESIGHSLVGDPVYARRRPRLTGAAAALTRQALHASRLSLRHPVSGSTMTWFRPPPQDLATLMRAVGFDPDRPLEAFTQAPAW